ncbi:MAG: UDP-N-acetylmuramoyl-tripeptide--D-alanyl-D-alanine ligase [Rikenellaceae bacterium]
MSNIEQLYELFRSYPRVTTDSRNIEAGSIFFALHGASFDGNDYALDALDKGAEYAVVDRADIAEQSDRLILVDDTLSALQDLARLHRQELNIPIIAITGSNGKTTTKELVAATLSTPYHIYATKGNFNNHIGVPLTLLSMDNSIEIGVVEMGASSQGEIALLCSIAEPNYGVITNIGRAHLDGFGGVEGIKRAKGELFKWLAESGGKAFVPQEDENILSIAAQYPTLEQIQYSYSLSNGVDSNLHGDYNLKNIATAMAISSKLGVSKIFAHQAISRYQPTNNRSQRVEGESNIIIADCYNANPSSMEAAILNFKSSSFDSCAKGKILILGDMLELGEWSNSEHTHIIELATSCNPRAVYLVGDNFRQSYLSLQSEDKRVKLFDSAATLNKFLRRSRPSSSAILIKGSHSIGLESTIEVVARY